MTTERFRAKLCGVAAAVFFAHASAFAGARLSLSALPGPVRPRAENETNVVFDAGFAGDNLWRLSIELEATASNAVEVVFGTDTNRDGELGVDEGELCIGWDCGAWFWRDRRGDEARRVEGSAGTRRLEWLLRLDGGRQARLIGGNVFSGAASPTCFNPDWDMARVSSRGAEPVLVASAVSVDALHLRVR